MKETIAAEHAVVEAVLYALRVGCFYPVPQPKPGAPTEAYVRWGAMRNLHNTIADLPVSAQDRTIPHDQ